MSEEKNSAITDDDFGGIFALTEDQISIDEGYGGERNPDYYSPSLRHKNVKDHYKSRIRFVPNVNDKSMQIVSKFIYYLPDPDNNDRNFYVDCPSNFSGKSSKGNILTTAFFYLKDNEAKVLRDMAKKFFSRKRYHWSLVQVMIDGFNEEEEGKVRIWRFGKQVGDMLEREKSDDASVNKIGIIPQDPFNGKDFIIWIEEKQIKENHKITSYEKSYFDDKITAMSFDKGETRIEDTSEKRKEIFKFLKEGSPDLSQCIAKEWDQRTEQKVIESVRSIIGDSQIFDIIYKKAYGVDAVYTAPSPVENVSTVITEEVVESAKSESLESKVSEDKVDAKSESKVSEDKVDAKSESKVSEDKVDAKSESKDASSNNGEFDDLNDMDFDSIDGK